MKLEGALAERFDRLELRPRQLPRAIERATGRSVVFLEPPAPYFLDRAALRAAVRVARSLDDPRIAPFVCDEPAAVYGGDDQPPLTPIERVVDAALDLIELAVLLAPHGCAPEPSLAHVTEGSSSTPVVPMRRRLHEREWLPIAWNEASPIAHWATARGIADMYRRRTHRELAHALAPRASDPRRAAARAAAIPDRIAIGALVMDFDVAITDGERTLAEIDARIATDPRHARARPFASWALAAAYHHRACTYFAAGRRADARHDVTRAIALDAHPRYRTTRALFGEAEGDVDTARADHDASVAGLVAITPVADPRGLVPILEGHDPPGSARRDGARTRIARAVFLAKHGDVAGALRDLEVAHALDDSGLAARWIARLRS